MPVGVLVPESEYLATAYRPDREYVDGHLVDRNVGEHDHSFLQAEIAAMLRESGRQLRFRVFTELRLKVRDADGERRYRIPDISVVELPYDRKPVLDRPPLLLIEILSPDDTMDDVLAKSDEYIDFGVPNIWLVDPRRRNVYRVDGTGLHQASNQRLTLAAAKWSIEVDFNQVFRELDAPTNE